jgi:hypothetical protein
VTKTLRSLTLQQYPFTPFGWEEVSINEEKKKSSEKACQQDVSLR